VARGPYVGHSWIRPIKSESDVSRFQLAQSRIMRIVIQVYKEMVIKTVSVCNFRRGRIRF